MKFSRLLLNHLCLGKSTQNRRRADDDDCRLSSLPDALLLDIISLLPIKSAVSTGVLSRRWHNLWTRITCITIDFRHFPNSYTSTFFIIDHFVKKLASPFIHTFTLTLHPNRLVCSYFLSIFLYVWLHKIRSRSVKVINIDISQTSTTPSFDPPPSLFQTRSLVQLYLLSKCEFVFPNDCEINLPNLKSLLLYIPPSQCSFVKKLVTSCPALEKMALLGNSTWLSRGGCIEISSPSLKILAMHFVLAPEATRFVINTPNLHSFLLYTPKDWNFMNYYPTNYYKPQVAVSVIISLSNIIKVSLTVNHLIVDLEFNTISSLRCLRVENGWATPLIFRHITNLIIDLYPVDQPSWSCGIPLRWLTNVKVIKINVHRLLDETRVLDLATRLLRRASALELLTVCVNSTASSDKKRELNLYSNLLKCQRNSPSRIEFLGKYVKLYGH